MELRTRRGLMIALIVVNIGVPTIFLTVRLLAHAIDPHSYGPAGGYDIFNSLVVGILFIFGFIVAATLGCTAGSVDLTEGVFRHLVITGRSRVALYFARIPAGLAILVPLVAAGFAIVCCVCAFAAPTKLSYDGVNVPPGLSRTALVHWADAHADEVYCAFSYNQSPGINLPCNNSGRIVTVVPGSASPGSVILKPPTKAQLEAAATKIANWNYKDYSNTFLSPPISLMVEAGLWVELEAILGFTIGLGLASLMGQRTVPIVLMIVLEVVLSPLLLHVGIPHLINAQRGLFGLAMAHIEPAALPPIIGGLRGGGNGPAGALIPESRTVAVCVIIAWLAGWTALGAWRMARRDV